MQRAGQAALVAAGGFKNNHIDRSVLELRDQLVPSIRVIEHTPLGRAQADIVMRLWRFDKVRYRGLAKNATRSFVALGLANIYLARGALDGRVRQ